MQNLCFNEHRFFYAAGFVILVATRHFMKPLFTIILVLFSCIAKAQDTSVNDLRFSVWIYPLSLIDLFDGSSYRFGAEHKLYRNIAVSLEAGGYFPFSGSPFTKSRPEGFLVKPAVKIYLNGKHLTMGRNITFEYSYKRQSYGYGDSIVLNGNPPFHKDYQMKRETTCINIKYGLTSFEGEGSLTFEWFAGVGARITNSYADLTEAEQEGRLTGEGHGAESGAAVRWTGRNIYPNITAGIRIGLKLR